MFNLSISLLDNYTLAMVSEMCTTQTYSLFSVTVSCGGSTSENCTYLSQAASTTPNTDSDDLNQQCSYSICPRTSTVNRIRLDLMVIIYIIVSSFKQLVVFAQVCNSSVFQYVNRFRCLCSALHRIVFQTKLLTFTKLLSITVIVSNLF